MARRKIRFSSKEQDKTFKYSLKTMESSGNGIQFSLCSKKITRNIKFNIQRINCSKIKTLSDNQKLIFLGLIIALFINFHQLLTVTLFWISKMKYSNSILSYVHLCEIQRTKTRILGLNPKFNPNPNSNMFFFFSVKNHSKLNPSNHTRLCKFETRKVEAVILTPTLLQNLSHSFCSKTSMVDAHSRG